VQEVFESQSSLTLAHKVLLAAQNQNGSFLPLDLAERKLQGTPGIIFSPGTTFIDVCHKLESYDLVRMDAAGQNMQVLEW
jgi:hypothetical protein